MVQESQEMAQMPQYECHKKVWALKIEKIVIRDSCPNEESDGSAIIHPADHTFSPLIVDHSYMRKHNPESGGYYVVYADGYKSFSPAEAFEKGYTLI